MEQFWPAVRARNFVKELRKQPGNYAKNMETLATIAGVHPKQMSLVNPVTFAERHFGHSSDYFVAANLKKILGNETYCELNQERHSLYSFSSAAWAYHKKEPIPPYVEPVADPAVASWRRRVAAGAAAVAAADALAVEPAPAPVAEPVPVPAPAVPEPQIKRYKMPQDCTAQEWHKEISLRVDDWVRLGANKKAAVASAAWAAAGSGGAAAVVAEPAVAPVVEEPMIPSAAVFKDGFGVECKTIMDFLAKINSICPAAARYPVAIEMFNYIMTIEPFLRKYPKFYEACLNKVLEFKTQNISYALRDVLLQTEDFLMRLREPAPAAVVEPAPSPTVTKRAYWKEFNTIVTFMDDINSLPMGSEREPLAIKLFQYIMTIGPFLRRFPKFYHSALNKVQEFKTQRISDDFKEVLLQTENFLLRLGGWMGQPDLLMEVDPLFINYCKSYHEMNPVEPPVDPRTLGTTYRVKNKGEYADFLEILKDYVNSDCWAIKVDDETIFNFYHDMSVKEYIELSILHDKISACPNILFVKMFEKKKDSTIMIDMYSNVSLVAKITYRAADETLTFLATSNRDNDI
jgi:hypothetical protein